MNERHIAIIEYVSRNKKVEVNRLAAYLHTSQVTIRKDLEQLSEKGILKRERGYALLNDPGSINYRMAFNYNVKQRIAQEAATLVEDGETIIVEAGSTCVMFADVIARTKRDVTMITNSVYVANYISGTGNVNIVLLGGNFQPRRQAVVGPMTKACIREFQVDKIFVGMDGYSREGGFTGDDLVRVDTLQAMIASANHTYVLAEAEKFLSAGTVSFLKTEEAYQVITDKSLSKEEQEYMRSKDVRVTCV